MSSGDQETSPLLANVEVNDNGTFSEASPSSSPEAGTTPEPGLSATALAITIIPLTVGVFLAAMDQTIVVASYATIGTELEQLQKSSWIATSYMLTLASFQPLYGKLSDIFGRKACLLSAYTIFGIGSLFCGLARTMDQLVLARAFAGMGGGGMTTVVSIVMSDIVPLRSRGTWQGLLNIIYAAGSISGAPLGGFLSDTIGWRWAFLFQVPPSILAFALVGTSRRIPAKVTGTPNPTSSTFRSNIKRVDFVGAFTLVTTIFFLLLGLERGGNISWTHDPLAISSLILFAFAAVGFYFVETRYASEPFAPKHIVANPALIAGYLLNFFAIASMMSLLFHVSLYLQAVKEYTPSQASLWFIPSVLASVGGSLGGGIIIQATGRYYILTILAHVVQLIGVVLIVLLTLPSGALGYSVPAMIIGLMLSSLGNGGGITTSLIAIIANAGPADQAVATAVSYLFRSIGAVVGVSLGSTIVQSALRTTLEAKLGLGGGDTEELVRHVRQSLSYIYMLPPATQIIVRESYAYAIHLTFWYTLAGTCGALVASLFVKETVLGGRK